MLRKTQLRRVKNSCLNKLFDFFKNFGRMTTYNFIQINIITPNYDYYKITHIKHRYEYFMTLILHKT
jgi:hypothetical protein